MCRGKNTCTELGDLPEAWSREAPLPAPHWFDEQLDVFAQAVRRAAAQDVMSARESLKVVRGDELREWYIEHGVLAGGFRYRHLGRIEAVRVASNSDPLKSPTRFETEVYHRDCYRCRYCGLRVIPRNILQAFAKAVGTDVFPLNAPNRETYGAALVFSATPDHVVPWNLGGRTDPNNLVTSCWSCNFSKSGYTLEQLGMDDPRLRCAKSGPWDGLTSLLLDLRRCRSTQ